MNIEFVWNQLLLIKGIGNILLLLHHLIRNGLYSKAHAGNGRFQDVFRQSCWLFQQLGGFVLMLGYPLGGGVEFIYDRFQHIRMLLGKFAVSQIKLMVTDQVFTCGNDTSTNLLFCSSKERVPNHPGIDGTTFKCGACVRRRQVHHLNVI
ncbi:hypothetical protein SDC9_168673 [bioreactor metagenome]|uniref:Uncharacterized protein n=1 Tax=bioreactor metagenome TaxID=1076179 RepID=A0A645GB53_9ZZZZ